MKAAASSMRKAAEVGNREFSDFDIASQGIEAGSFAGEALVLIEERQERFADLRIGAFGERAKHGVESRAI